MDRKEIMEKLQKILAEELNLSGVKITEQTSFKKDLEVDSLDLFQLVMSLEEEFGVEISTDAVDGIETVGDVVNYLSERE